MIETAAHAMAPQAADPAFAAVIFDMDGVVTDPAGLHAAAWQAFFDQVLPLMLRRRSRPSDIGCDYDAHIDGGNREVGVRAERDRRRRRQSAPKPDRRPASGPDESVWFGWHLAAEMPVS